MKKLFALTTVALLLSGCNINYSDGARIGTIYKLSHKGLLCPTWEGEMAVAGVQIGDNSNGNIFEFTVSDPVFLGQIQKDMSASAKVRITYRQVWNPTPCSTDSGYFVTGIQEVK